MSHDDDDNIVPFPTSEEREALRNAREAQIVHDSLQRFAKIFDFPFSLIDTSVAEDPESFTVFTNNFRHTTGNTMQTPHDTDASKNVCAFIKQLNFMCAHAVPQCENINGEEKELFVKAKETIELNFKHQTDEIKRVTILRLMSALCACGSDWVIRSHFHILLGRICDPTNDEAYNRVLCDATSYCFGMRKSFVHFIYEGRRCWMGVSPHLPMILVGYVEASKAIFDAYRKDETWAWDLPMEVHDINTGYRGPDDKLMGEEDTYLIATGFNNLSDIGLTAVDMLANLKETVEYLNGYENDVTNITAMFGKPLTAVKPLLLEYKHE